MNQDPMPTPAELRAMAYADGELSDEETREFEREMIDDPQLAREVAQLKRLEVLSRQVAGPEPMDTEWKRLAEDPWQRAGHGLAWTALSIGVAGLAIAFVVAIAMVDTSPLVKALLLLVVGGFGLLLVLTIRGRLRTLPYDPYTKVQR
jgi:anti-sigma factor RsiW